MPEKRKYSLWIVPTSTNEQLPQLISTLSQEMATPIFDPHVTLVANIFASDDEIESVRQIASQLAVSLDDFTMDLGPYGYTNEEFRSFYLLANSPALPDVYKRTAAVFPQVRDEHFAAMPHVSILYGNYSADAKQQIIAQHPLQYLRYEISSIALYLTDGSVESWKRDSQFEFSGK